MRPNETLFRPFAKTLPFRSRAGGLGVVRGDQHGARQPGLIRPIWLSAVARGVLFLSQQKLARRKRDLTAGGIFDVRCKSKAYACSGWMFDGLSACYICARLCNLRILKYISCLFFLCSVGDNPEAHTHTHTHLPALAHISKY